MAEEEDKGLRPPRNVGELLQLSIANQSSSENPIQPLSQERQEWLNQALEGLTTNPVEKMKSCVATLQNTESSTESCVMALEELTEWCEQIDFAIDFHKIGAFPILLVLFNSEEPEIRWRTLELVATLVQNNTYCQTAALKEDLLSKMLTILDNDSDAMVKTKALYAISCLTRDSSEAQKVFSENDGFSVLMRAMQCDVEKLKIKASFMLSQMCSSNPAFKDILCDIGMIDQLVGELSDQHVNYHEHLMSALLAIVKDHQRAIEECQRSELQLTQLLLNRIELLKGKEECLEEKCYAEELLSIISSESGDVMR